MIGLAIVFEKCVSGKFSAFCQYVVSAGTFRVQSQKGHRLGDDGKLTIQVILCLGDKESKVEITQIMEYSATTG